MIFDISRLQKKVTEKISENQYKELKDIENELKSIQSEKYEAESVSFSQIMRSARPSVMISASFYHACMILEIPCVLEVQGKWGIMDAIIEMNGQFYVIEFKSHEASLKEKITYDQIKRYAQCHSVVIALTGMNSFTQFLIDLKKKNYRQGIFIYRSGKFKRHKLSTPTRKTKEK